MSVESVVCTFFGMERNPVALEVIPKRVILFVSYRRDTSLRDPDTGHFLMVYKWEVHLSSEPGYYHFTGWCNMGELDGYLINLQVHSDDIYIADMGPRIAARQRYLL